MHYYKFDISAWAIHTAHLSLEEEAVYFRLINFYYDTELPIPIDPSAALRKLRLSKHSSTAKVILSEFFELLPDGWHHNRCDKELSIYHGMAERARQVGRLGGRPKTKVETAPVPPDNPDITLTKNYKLETINYELPPCNEVEPEVDIIDFRPSTVTAITVALRSLGVRNIIQTHPHFVRLVADGAEVQEFIDAGKVAMSTGKPFAYVVAIVKRQREEMQQAIKDTPVVAAGKVTNWMSSLELTHQRCKQEGIEVIDDLRQLRINLNEHIQSQYR